VFRNLEPFIHGFDEFHNGVFVSGVAFESLGGRTLDDWGIVAIIAVFVQEFADVHLDEFDEIRISEVHLVQEDDDLWHVHLVSQKHVLTSLWQRTVIRCYHENSTIDLRSTGNHVLDVVGVTWHVNVSVVTLLRFVLLVRGSDGDTTSLLFWSVIDLVVSNSFVYVCWKFLCENVSNRSGKSSLTVVNVAHSTNVDMWFGTVKFCHSFSF
jgi:hypothetical protein